MRSLNAARVPDSDVAAVPKRDRGHWKEFLLYFLRLGTLGFGGPIALAGYMQRDLVEERGWITKEEYVEGLALAQLAPGPLAAQLAIYLGWVRGGIAGATLVGIVFILPSFLMVLLLGALYVRFGGLPWMQGVFYGIGASVIAIVARSAVKLGRMTIAKDPLLWALFLVNAGTTVFTGRELVLVFVLSGVVAMFAKAPPKRATLSKALMVVPWGATGLAGVASGSTLLSVALYFAGAGVFVFGSGLAIVPFLHGGVVDTYHWLNDRQFLDAVAVAMITPGPVVITVAFIGYLVAGLAGAFASAAGVFLPCYLIVVVLASSYHRLVANPSIKAFVSGVTAAAAGAIGGAAVILGRRAIVDLPTAAICLVTLALLVRVRKIPEPLVILAAGAVGVALKVFAAV